MAEKSKRGGMHSRWLACTGSGRRLALPRRPRWHAGADSSPTASFWERQGPPQTCFLCQKTAQSLRFRARVGMLPKDSLTRVHLYRTTTRDRNQVHPRPHWTLEQSPSQHLAGPHTIQAKGKHMRSIAKKAGRVQGMGSPSRGQKGRRLK